MSVCLSAMVNARKHQFKLFKHLLISPPPRFDSRTHSAIPTIDDARAIYLGEVRSRILCCALSSSANKSDLYRTICGGSPSPVRNSRANIYYIYTNRVVCGIQNSICLGVRDLQGHAHNRAGKSSLSSRYGGVVVPVLLPHPIETSDVWARFRRIENNCACTIINICLYTYTICYCCLPELKI